MPTILLVRHAQASFGAADYDVLSELGHEQAAALGEGLRRRGVAPVRVVSGRLRRQRDTAAPLAEATGGALEVDERFDEYDDADVLTHHSGSAARLAGGEDGEALTSRDFQVILNEGLTSWVRAGAESPCSTPWPAFLARASGGLQDVAEGLGKGETALVVSSSGVIAALAAELLGLPPEAFVALNHVSVNTAVSKVVAGRGGLSLVTYNEHVHLEEAGARLISYR